jgi:hypothetical protein
MRAQFGVYSAGVALVLAAVLAASAGARPPAWQRLISDLFAGNTGQRYSCATAQQALRHVPIAGASSSVLWIERRLATYRRTVC